MRPLPILGSAAGLGIDLQAVAEAGAAALAADPDFRFEGTRVTARNDHPAVTALGAELLPAVREVTGDPFLEPAKTHVLHYLQGDALGRHRDRANLDVTVSVLLRLDGQDRWRIGYEPGRGRPGASYPQRAGDAFIMDGKLRTHWRDPLAGREAVVVMCHYQRPGGMVWLEPDIPRAEIDALMRWVNEDVAARRWFHGSVLGNKREAVDVWATRRVILQKQNGGWEAHACARLDEVLAFGHPNLEPLDYVQYTVYSPEMGRGGGHFDWHVDSRGGQPDEPPHLARRVLSGSLVLEAPEEGGVLEIKDAPAAPQTAGSAILFPSNRTLHRVTPVKRGRRVSLVGWAYEWGRPPRNNPFVD